MTCYHPYKSIQPTLNGFICTSCKEKFNDSAAFAWTHISHAFADMKTRIEQLEEIVAIKLKLEACAYCNKWLAHPYKTQGIQINGNPVCRECLPEYLALSVNDNEIQDILKQVAHWMINAAVHNPATSMDDGESWERMRRQYSDDYQCDIEDFGRVCRRLQMDWPELAKTGAYVSAEIKQLP